MGFPTFTFPIDQIGTVELVFPIGDLLDHGTRCLAVGRRAVGLQVVFRRIEPVKTILDLVFQDIHIPAPKALDLSFFQLSLNRFPIVETLTLIWEW